MHHERELAHKELPFHAYGSMRGRFRRPFAIKFKCASSFSGYEDLIRHICREAVAKGQNPSVVPGMGPILRDIAGSLEKLRFVGNKKGALIIISETALCFPYPLKALASFRSTYSMIEKMAAAVSARKMAPVPPALRSEAEECEKTVEAFCTIMGLREMRWKAATSVLRGEGAYTLPRIRDEGMVGYVNPGPLLEHGRRRDFRNPVAVRLKMHEPRGRYELTIGDISGRIVGKNESAKGGAAWAESTLSDIVQAMKSFNFSGTIKRALCTIAEACLLYENPPHVLDAFRRTFILMSQIAADNRKGRKQPVGAGREGLARDFDERLQKFRTLSGLIEIRRNAALASNGSHSTYEVPFLTRNQLDEIGSDMLRSSWNILR